MKLAGLEVLGDETVGEGGFLHVRRVRLQNRRADGSASRPYVCDFVERPFGIDAVAVVIYRRGDAGVEVLLRTCLRPSLQFGRVDGRDFRSVEIVAGIVERQDIGEAGVIRRACEEVLEEAGYTVAEDGIELLGAASFPSVGIIAERIHLTCVEVSPSAVPSAPEGDGSPMEEGGEIEWVALDDAIERCVRGEVADMKTELALRRLRDRLR